MSFDTARSSIELAVSKSSGPEISITFVGGEPLLKRELIKQIVEDCKQHDKHVFFFSILTNGILLDKDFLEFCLRNNVSISLSLDGIKQAHDRFRKIGEDQSWDLIMEKFRLLLAIMPTSMILITLNPETTKYLFESIKYLVEQKAKAISVSLNYMVKWTEQDLALLNDQMVLTADYYHDSYLTGDTFYLNLFESRISTLIDGKCNKGRCAVGFNHLSVAPDGGYFPCIAFVEPAGFYQVGNAADGPDLERWTELNTLNQPNQRECLDCAIKERCFNWCACSNYLGTGKGSTISPTLCGLEKMLIPLADGIAEKLFKANNRIFMDKFYNV